MRLSQLPLPKHPVQSVAESNYASEFHARLVKWINDFDQGLDAEHEVGIRLVNFGQTIQFHLKEVGFWNPSLMIFYGTTLEGDPVELVQHVTQISVLLVRLPRLDPSKPKHRMGFNREHEERPS
jgi:hypothetical protein